MPDIPDTPSMHATVKVQNGSITLPDWALARLGAKEGDWLEISYDGEALQLHKAPNQGGEPSGEK